MRLLRIFVSALLWAVFSCGNIYAAAPSGVPVTAADPGPALEYALSLADEGGTAGFIPERIAPLVDFIVAGKDAQGFPLPKQKGLTGVSYAFTTRVSLKKVLGYLYNPDIPTYLLMPSSVRISSWVGFVGGKESLENFDTLYDSLTVPVVVAGTEREMITPDATTGGYYAYDADRVLVLFRRGTDRVLLSVSRQRDVSEVGCKGGVVGDDSNWNYLFSGERGLTKTGLGWVKSYMYGARSVTVYVQPDDRAKPLRVAIYKWLRAGWAGMNMVKEQHILGGVERYVSTLREILESPQLPPRKELEQMVARVRGQSEAELRETVQPYFQALCSLDDPIVRKRVFAGKLKNGAYAAGLKRDELERIVLLEYLKCRLGKESLLGPRFCLEGIGVNTARLNN